MNRTCMAAIAAAASLATLPGCASKPAQAQGGGKGAPEAVELMVYSDDFAMVREQREVRLGQGRTRLHIANVSKSLDPTSVLFSWDKPGPAQVVSNTYDLGIGESSDLLRRYVGEDVEVVWFGQDGKEGVRKSGKLQLVANGTVVESEGKLIFDPGATIIAPARPDLVTIPQLSVDVDCERQSEERLAVTYLTRGLSWRADYVANLDPTSDKMTLECWATVTNQTGTSFRDATVTLVAGSPNRAAADEQPQTAGIRGGGYAGQVVRKSEMGVTMGTPSAVGELYAYPIKAKATIAPDRMNRVRMLSASVPITKDYSVRVASSGFGGSPYRQHAQLAIRTVNTEQNGLGIPLPGGTVRVYEPSSSTTTFVGAASIGDTPKENRIDLTLTDAFDVTTETRLVKTERIDKKHVRRDYEVALSNMKKSTIKLRVVAVTYGLKIASESIKSLPVDAYTRQWTVPLGAESRTKLTYSIISAY